MYNIGFRAHDFGSYQSVEALSETVNSIINNAPLQLAPLKSFPSKGVDVFSEDFASLCSSLLNVRIIGSYFNPVHPDEDERRHGIDVFSRFLSVANAYGAYAVATETGSIDPDCGYHPDTGKEETLFLFYRSLECMMNSAQKYNARVAIEPVSTNHTISTLKRMEDMIRRFDSDNLAIILDVANITPLSGIMERDGVSLPKPSDNALCAFLSDFISIAGPHLAAVHVKNYALDGKGAKISDLKADEGAINWNLACSFINERYPEIPFLIEGSLNDRELFLSSLEKEV